MAQDEFFTREPHPSHTRDRWSNVHGGNTLYRLVSCFEQETAFDVLNDFIKDAAFDILNQFDKQTSFDILNVFTKAVAWDLINTFTKDTSWDVINTFTKNTSWDILNSWTKATSWDIINTFTKSTSWHIHPAVIDYIQQFLLKYIRTEFEIKYKLESSFDVDPIETNFNVTGSIVTSSKLAANDADRTAYKMKELIQFNFTLRQPITKNFVITRILNNTRTP